MIHCQRFGQTNKVTNTRQEIIRSIRESPAILMKNHGVFTIGETPEAAVKAAGGYDSIYDVARTLAHLKQKK